MLLRSCMACPPVPGLPAWACLCVALSALPSLPQKGYSVRAKQKEAFEVGVGSSGEWVQALTGRQTPFLGLPVAPAAPCKAPGLVWGQL